MNFNFFQGRYGWDRLSTFLVVLSLPFFMSKYTMILGIVLLVYALGRALSKDVISRGNEAMRFESKIRSISGSAAGSRRYSGKKQGIKGSFNNFKKSMEEKKKYKITACPKCGQKLRLPRGKGKIVVTCKKCGYDFKMKT